MRYLRRLAFILTFLFFMPLLTSCWAIRQGLPVEKISEIDYLLQAKNLTVEAFFHLRMQNRPRKAPVGMWMILHEDAVFVYLGYPHFDGLSEHRSISELYRTRKSELIKAFPTYRQIDGNRVRLAAQVALQEHLDRSVSLSWEQWAADLNGTVIDVKAKIFEKDADTIPVSFHVRLSATDLSILDIRQAK